MSAVELLAALNRLRVAGGEMCTPLLPPQRLQPLLPSPVGEPYWFGSISACFSSSGSRILQCRYFVSPCVFVVRDSV